VSADSRSAIAAALADRYELVRELGRGGMATVYLANDLRHDRPVALKVLHPQLAATLGPERFLREIKLAARLQHPHVLTVLDSGEAAGQLWFTMPFIEGESLRDRLTREKQLPVEDALRIAREAADGLEYAHRHGVIHRDIKPENILLSDNHALVADFGIARALRGGEHLTETGMAIGTPAYMSPEQAAGERDLDARTDVYSLGSVLFEMLAGEPPFTGPTAQAIAARRLTGDVPNLRQLRTAVPESVERAVRKALAAVPADRFASAADFARALAPTAEIAPPATTVSPVAPRPAHRHRSVVLLGLGFLLGLGVLFGWLRRHGGEPGSPGSGEVKRLAVLPFDNLGAPDDEYFADGITDEIRGKLSSIPGLQVTASRSAAEYKKSGKDLATIARELGVDYLLVGKVRWEKGEAGRSRVRVSPELIQVATGSTKWEQPFEANLTDVFQVQADVAGRVAQSLDVALGAGEKQALAERPTANLAAYDAYLKGEEMSKSMAMSDPASLRRALVYYDQAIALDSTFAIAWAQRARAYSVVYANSVPDPELARAALASAERARALAPDRPEGYLALTDYYRVVTGDGARAFEQAQQGLKVAPADVNLLVGAALAQQAQGRWEAATELLRRAHAIDPRSSSTGWRLARGLLFRRRYDEALAACERGLQIAPTHLGLLETRAMIAAAQGDFATARAAFQRAPAAVEPAAFVAYVANFYDLFWLLDESQRALLYQLTPAQFDDDRGTWGLALAGAYGLQGNGQKTRAYADSAQAGFEEQIRAAPTDGQLHALHGVALAYLGRKADAIREGQRGVELTPISRNAFAAPYMLHQLARIYILVGEPDKAIDQLEALLKIPYFLSPGWLRIDPAFDPLRKLPRFQKLAEGTT
jgi:eukaryotic-like serine/threonine-protein kinase